MDSHGNSRWPGGARAAVTLTLDNMGEAAELNLGLWSPSEPVGSHYSVKEALPQLLAILKKYDILVTYFVEAWNLSVYPEVIAQDLAGAGHEISFHAWQHESWAKLEDEHAERANLERSFHGPQGIREFLMRHDGLVDAYRGFRPPGGLINGQRTLRMCKEFGVRYISPAAEEAALIPIETSHNNNEPMVILPFKWTSVDAYYYMDAFAKMWKMKGDPPTVQSPQQVSKRFKEDIDRTIEKGRFTSLLFHPFLQDRPERLECFEEVVSYLAEKRDRGDIWLARATDVQGWISEHPEVVGNDPEWDLSTWW